MEKDIYKSSRWCYIAEAALEYFISITITGAYLAKLTAHLGFSDSLTAILSAFVALGCSFQLFTIAFFRRGPVKRRVTIMHMVNQLLFMAIYIVPFFKIGSGAKTVLFIVFLLGGYFLSNVVSSPKINWFMSLVDDAKRGVFTSVKEAVSLIGGFVFNFCMGAVIDKFEAQGNIRGAFAVGAVVIFVLMVLHTLTLVFSKEKERKELPAEVTVAQRFKNVFADKNIMLVIAVSVFWTISSHIATSFFGTYQTKELGFSMTFVAVLSILGSAVRIPCSFIFGRFADKHSFARMLKFAYGLAALAFLFAALARPSNGKIFYTIYHLLYAAAMGGANSAEINLIFDYAAPERRQDTLMVKQTIYGVCGFLATLAATPLVNHIQAAGNTLLGLNVYAQQVLSFVSFICTVLLIIYIDRVILKIKPVNKEQI